ncbi:MAG: transglycosylase SLT domain-containing protein [Flavobacteriales bacterium]|nr:transglycosylase SLT domain-containing protein [Flavobacteriales bacterium]
MRGKILAVLLMLAFAHGQSQIDTTYFGSDTILTFQDDPELAMMDSMLVAAFAHHFCFTDDTLFLNVYDFHADSIPHVSPEILEMRMNQLNAVSQMDLVWNDDVEKFIYLYAQRRRELTGRAIGMAQLYFPLFENMLDKYDLPEELKYLPIVESALNPQARSRVGAVGLWQFMLQTGRQYGLKVNGYVDERMDPYLATDAACRYLARLYEMYGDWSLALAAYNSGPGNVNKAIRRAGGVKDYWVVRNYLPRETKGYVPAFIAVNYVMNHAEDHNIFPCAPLYSFFECDTVHVHSELQFEQIAAFTGLGTNDLEYLNPRYRRNVIPDDGRQNFVCIPRDFVGVYLMNEDSMLAYKPVESEIKPPAQDEIVHVVRRGEVLGKIAQNYNVGVSSLKEWNNLRSNTIYPGQKLVIYTQSKPAPKKTKTPVTLEDSEYIYHVVQQGDTLWDIAKLYQGVSVTEIEQLNRDINVNRLKLGQKIKIPKTS